MEHKDAMFFFGSAQLSTFFFVYSFLCVQLDLLAQPLQGTLKTNQRLQRHTLEERTFV